MDFKCNYIRVEWIDEVTRQGQKSPISNIYADKFYTDTQEETDALVIKLKEIAHNNNLIADIAIYPEVYSVNKLAYHNDKISDQDKLAIYTYIYTYNSESEFRKYMLKDLVKYQKLLIELGYESSNDNNVDEEIIRVESVKPNIINDTIINNSFDDLNQLNETTLKDLLMAAGITAGIGAGAYNIASDFSKEHPNTYQKPEIQQRVSQPVKQQNTVAKVPQTTKPQKVSVNNKTTTQTKKPTVTTAKSTVKPKATVSKTASKSATPTKSKNTTIKVKNTTKTTDYLNPKKPNIDWGTSSNKSSNNVVKATKNIISKAAQQVSNAAKNVVAKGISNPWFDRNGNVWDVDKAVEFVMDLEEFHPKAYRDGKTTHKGKVTPRYSIGYGTLSPNNNPKAIITKQAAKQAAIKHIKHDILPLMRKIKINSQNEFDSIVSFVYNIGHLPPLNANREVDWDKAYKYIYFQGKVNAGLQRRRDAEYYHSKMLDDL